MELKDVILSTLAEMEEDAPIPTLSPELKVKKEIKVRTPLKMNQVKNDSVTSIVRELEENTTEDEMQFLNSLRERLLVLFEGFQAPNNTNIEAKIDMTLNFLEYVLATIDDRIDLTKKGNRE